MEAGAWGKVVEFVLKRKFSETTLACYATYGKIILVYIMQYVV